MSIDTHAQTGYTPFFITFTAVSEYSDGFEDALKSWHSKKCDQVLLVREGGVGDQHLHYHSVGTFRAKQAVGVTRQCETFYKKQNMQWTKGVSVKVKAVSDLIGLFWYLTKDFLTEDNPDPLLTKGWKMSWIKQKCLDNLKKMPHKMLLKDQYSLTPKTATNMILEYSRRKSLPITGKESFKSVLKSMIKDHYRVNAIWPKITIIYAEVMIECGDDSGFDSVFESAFQFI